MESWLLFLFGVFGSLSVELVNIYRMYDNEKALPVRYKKLGFWIVRILLSLVGGGLVLAYNITIPILAIHIGAATPLIIQQLARTAPE
jgi:hypothetical protein